MQRSSVGPILSDVGKQSGLPVFVKALLILSFGSVGLFALTRILQYSLKPDSKPSDGGLLPLLAGCVSVVAVLLIPFDRLGMRVKKVAGLEFEEVLRTQKTEQIDEVVYLQRQIDELKAKLKGLSSQLEPASEEQEGLSEASNKEILKQLLTKFFRDFAGWYFNARRIYEWGSLQAGYSDFCKFDVPQINEQILSLTESGLLSSKIGHGGTTVYGVPKTS